MAVLTSVDTDRNWWSGGVRTAAVVGTGLIGTSIALALTRRRVTTYLSDVDHQAALTAAGMGAGILGEPPEPVDLAIVAVPPTEVAGVIAAHQERGLARVFTDVAAVKILPQRDVEALGCDVSWYVGGHPMAGMERSGPFHARGDLFRGRPWALTPSEQSRPAALAAARELVRLCDATPLEMTHTLHDEAVALVSHVPHIAASLVAARLAGAPEEVLQLCGAGVRDVTRIAGGDAQLWTDIVGGNAEEIVDVLSDLAVDLAGLVTALRDIASGSQAAKASAEGRLEELLRKGQAGNQRVTERLTVQPYAVATSPANAIGADALPAAAPRPVAEGRWSAP